MLRIQRENSHLLYNLQNFIGFTITQPKMRIKLPKLNVKTMRRRDNRSSCAPIDGNRSNNKRSAQAKQKAKIRLLKKIGSIFSKGLGRKKSWKMSSSTAETVMVTRILPGHEEDELRSLRTDTRCTNNRNIWDLIFPLGVPRTPTLSISWSFNEMLGGKFNDGESSEKSADAGKRALKICFSPRRFLSKRTGFNNFSTWKVSNRNSGNLGSIEDTSDSSSVCDETSDNHVTGQKIPKILFRFPCRKPCGYRKIKTRTIVSSSVVLKIQKTKTRKFVLRKFTRQAEDSKSGNGKAGGKEETGKVELCKKRILMGGRCRPLNVSGRLHYDENGFLVPEEVIFSEES